MSHHQGRHHTSSRSRHGEWERSEHSHHSSSRRGEKEHGRHSSSSCSSSRGSAQDKRHHEKEKKATASSSHSPAPPAATKGGKLVTSSSILKSAIQDAVQLMIQEHAMSVVHSYGMQFRRGELEMGGSLKEPPEDMRVVEAPGLDIFGVPVSKKYDFNCKCPTCHRSLAAQRFAPHLEKCMGMGRNSSRIANRRLAAGSSGSQNSQNGNGGSSQGSEKGSSQGTAVGGNGGAQQNGEFQSEEEHFEEDEDDEDWTMERKKRSSKKAATKISPKNYV